MGITASIVSHGHRAQVEALLAQFAALPAGSGLRRVILTQNIVEPAPSATGWPFDLRRLVNPVPAGFGANHNRAFAEDARLGASAHFAVVNPDVRLAGDPFAALIAALAAPDAGCAYPRQIDAQGRAQDHERALPSPLALFERHLAPRQRRSAPENTPPDWVNAAFLMFPQQVFAALGGFDSRYHMYCEDVDLCLRMQLRGWKIRRAEQALVVHVGQRASRREMRHLRWHVASLWRLWNSDAYRDFKRLRAASR